MKDQKIYRPAPVGQVHAAEAISTLEAIRSVEVVLDAAVGVRNSEVIDSDVIWTLNVGVVPDTVAVEVTKELDSQQAIEDPEEDKEQGHIVDLLAGPLKDLVEPGLGHGELEAGPDVSDHDEGPGRPRQTEGRVVVVREFEAVLTNKKIVLRVFTNEKRVLPVHNNRGDNQSQHGKVKLTPSGP